MAINQDSTLIGRTLGHFEIVDKLGEGGMGVVYKARDNHLDRLVAIKILPPAKAEDVDRRRRFAQEAKTASALNHPGIITIYDITQHEGIDFIAMEFVPGRTLDRVIPRRGMRLNDTLNYAVQIADALAAAHAAGIVHRDLKPTNVIVTEQGRLKVLDFGLAKLTDRAGLVIRDDTRTVTELGPGTDQGVIVGTVAYMSPEQAEGKTVDARSDIFSFGSVLYEMVTGQRAFQGDSPLSTLTAVLREEPKPVSTISAALPRDLERLISRCLRKAPERRWQAMADVKVALRELKDESESGALAVSAPVVHRAYRVWPILTAVILAVAALTGALVWRQRRGPPPEPAAVPFNAVPLTTYQGREQQLSFSPDGNSFAFSWNGEKEDNWDIYVKLIGPGSSHRLTTDPAMDISPTWSPDGNLIAFVRVHGDRLVVIVVPSRDGLESEVLETASADPYRPLWSPAFGVGQMLSWSADSRFLVVGASPSGETPGALTAVDVATRETRRMTTPPPGGSGDSLPSVSPDGKGLAFVRGSGITRGELHVQDLSPGFTPIRGPRPLETEGRLYNGVTWSADGHDLIVSSSINPADTALWRIPLSRPERTKRLSPPGDDSRQPAVAIHKGRLAFTRTRWDENLWSVALSASNRPSTDPVSLIGSTQPEAYAQFSRDGTQIAFGSHRSGTEEVWVADRDGRNARKLTSFNGRQGGTPSWSPDGQRIAYDLRDGARGNIYVISARGGSPRQIADHPADDLVPNWSRDGRWIYFASTRSGTQQVWKVSPEGGEPKRVTQDGGAYAKESVDGYIYYARLDSALPTLCRVPVAGGKEVVVVPHMANWAFAIGPDGIYFEPAPASTPVRQLPVLSPFARPEYRIVFLSFTTGKVTPVLTIPRHAGHGLDVSPDGRTLLWAQLDSYTEDLMLVENFK